MGKCLITKLNGTVSDNSIPKLGELRITFNSNAASHKGKKITVKFIVDTEIKCSGGYFSDSTLSSNKGTIISVPAQQQTDLYVVGNEGYLSIANGKYNLSLINLTNSIFAIDISDINYNKYLNYVIVQQSPTYGDIKGISKLVDTTDLSLFLTKVSGNISILANFTKLETLNLARAPLTGDIAALADITTLRTVTLDSQDLYGDISAFAKSINLADLYIPRLPNIHGSIEELAENMKNAGRISGTLTVTCSGSNITYNGSVVESKKINFSTSGVTYSD